METEEKREIAEKAGFRFATFGEFESGKATHEICDCGTIAAKEEINHFCTWTWLVRRTLRN